jgi:hypothetical protein
MKALRLVAGTFLFLLVLIFSRQASATNSPDGSSITPAGGGSLVNSAGTWTFSSSTNGGGNLILLNGVQAGGGSGTELLVANGGHMYALNLEGDWYKWSGSGWTGLSGTPVPISANGSSMEPGGSVDLVNSQGIWAFSTSTNGGGNLILLNGVQIGSGSGTELLVDNGFQMYALNSEGDWYFWSVSLGAWVKTTNPIAAFSPYCASAVIVGLQWTAVGGAATYNITRNGSSIETGTTLLAYNDKGVKASTTYAYVLTALNSSGGTVSTQDLSVSTPVVSTTGDPAYCPSSSIAGVTPNWSLGIYQANGSDLWSQTLGSDGNQYGYWGDGQGFGGTETGSTDKVAWGIGAITSSTGGTLTGAVNVYGGLNAEHPGVISGKATSILEIGPSDNMNFYALGGTKLPSDNDQNYGGSGINDQDIVYSTGNSWSWVDNDTNWEFCVNGQTASIFCPMAFLQNGAGYSGNTDGYVYLYGGTEGSFFGNGTPGTALTYLWRVPTSQSSILSATDYEAFGGFNANGTPIWLTGSISSLSSSMVPVFSDVQQSSAAPMVISEVSYNPGIGRYIASAEGNVNSVAFYDAPNPWGPWTLIGYYNANPSTNAGGWGNLGEGISTTNWGGTQGAALGINFVDKWMSSNGQTMWVVFSSNGNASSSATLTALQGQNMDGFIALPLTVTPAP